MTLLSRSPATSLDPDVESLMVTGLLSFPLHTPQISSRVSELSILSQPNGYTEKGFTNFYTPSGLHIRNCYNENITLRYSYHWASYNPAILNITIDSIFAGDN